MARRRARSSAKAVRECCRVITVGSRMSWPLVACWPRGRHAQNRGSRGLPVNTLRYFRCASCYDMYSAPIGRLGARRVDDDANLLHDGSSVRPASCTLFRTCRALGLSSKPVLRESF